MRLYQHLSWHKELPPAELQKYDYYYDIRLRALGNRAFEATRHIYNTHDDNGSQVIIPPGSTLQLAAQDPYGEATETARYYRTISAVHQDQTLSFCYTDPHIRNPDYDSDPCILGDISLDSQSVFINSDEV